MSPLEEQRGRWMLRKQLSENSLRTFDLGNVVKNWLIVLLGLFPTMAKEWKFFKALLSLEACKADDSAIYTPTTVYESYY